MRCPKCHYISFEAADRCRNCGYDFSLSVDVAALDLPIQTGEEPIGPLSDFSLTDLDTPQPAPAAGPGHARAATSRDLPLFKDRTPDDDRPLVTPPAVPRPPLAVRKSTPIARPAVRPRTDEPELDLEPPEPEIPSTPVAGSIIPARAGTPQPAPLARRAAAVAIDAALLGFVDGVVLYFTLRLCGLQLAEIGLVPVVPFLSFVLLQNGGYLAAFVALGGQTIGKMAVAIRVVPSAADAWTDRVPLGTSALRAAIWILTVLPAGIGLLPALISADHRTVHDRLAGTRVVNA
jgi:uncharacterized RDD family membrane protein YckC